MKKSFFKKMAVLTALLIISFSACKEPEPARACEVNSTGTVVFENWSNNPYDCYIDGTYKGRVASKSSMNVNSVRAGYHSFKTIQTSGYILYPSEYIGGGTLNACYKFTFVFP